MRKHRTTVLLILLAGALGAAGLIAVAQRRLADCAYVPIAGGELLPNAALAPDPASPRQAAGWGYRTSNGVELQQPSRDHKGFDLDRDDRALQLIGIGNYVETPPVAVRPGASYCFAGAALTDEAAKGATRARLVFRWLDAGGAELASAAGDWQPVALWQPGATSWSALRAAFRAPAGAAALRVRVQPAADNRLYLDAMHVRRGGRPALGSVAPPAPAAAQLPAIAPWPNGYRAALSFSWDWETTMGGLIHSRSADDMNAGDDPVVRGMRMRAGITTTLALFQRYDIQSTYYATGYNFLLGNRERRLFMGNPTFGWATQRAAGRPGWLSDRWTKTPWFGDDPYGTDQSDPAWYFGDLIPALARDRHDIQSHTFSHLYGGYASVAEWRADLAAWRDVAAERGVGPARSLAFPWSSSAGMSDANWLALEAAGITSVTRTSWSQPNYQLADRIGWRCLPVPGHERILACPDFYLIAGRATPASAGIAQAHAGGDRAAATAAIDAAVAAGGVIDIWAHTEEATTPAQIADWQAVIAHAARARDAGQLWVAPLAEIADWQAAVAKVKVQSIEFKVADTANPLAFSITNESDRGLNGLTINAPFNVGKCIVNGQELKTHHSNLLTLNLAAGQSVEVQAWPA